MSTSRAQYGTLETVNVTLNGPLSAGAARESDPIDNSENGFLDAELLVSLTLEGDTPADLEQVIVYAVPSPDGVTWPTPLAGVNAAVSLTAGDPALGHRLGHLETPSAGAGSPPTQTLVGHWRTLLAYDGALALAPFVAIVVENRSGMDITDGTVQILGKYIQDV